MDVGLLILRLAIGGVMAAHGAQKLFGWFGGHGVEGTGGWLESLGFKPGRLHATLTGFSELGGGALLILGLLTPFAAAAVVGVMIVAIATVHGDNGFFNTAGGFEFNLVLIASALALAFTGAGRFSLDDALDLGIGGATWGLFAFVLGLAGAAVVLITRVPVPAQASDTGSQTDRVIDVTDDQRSSVGAGR
jgi:putative oxidoreductase